MVLTADKLYRNIGPIRQPISEDKKTMDIVLDIPPQFRRGSLRDDQIASIQSGLALLDLIDRNHPLAGSRILDFGCGVKLAQALRQKGDPQDSYVGLDVYGAMITHISTALANIRGYSFATVDFHNDMYNPTGVPMTKESKLPVPDQEFDILTMFSVVTHLAPQDTAAILTILSKYAAPTSTLIFSAFSDNKQSEDFIDKDPQRPLLNALYRREYLDEIIRQSGWRIVSFNPPIQSVIQRHYICKLA